MELNPVAATTERFFGNVDVTDEGYVGNVAGSPLLRFNQDDEELVLTGDLVLSGGEISFDSTARIGWAKKTAASITKGNGGFDGTTGDTSGLVGDIATAFDGNLLHIDEVAAGFDIIISFTSITAFNWVQCLCNYKGSVSHAVMVQVYNWVSGVYDSFRIVPAAIAEFGAGINTIGDSGFFVPDDSAYIGTGANDGKVNVRILHNSSGNSAHDFYIDCVALYQ